MKDLTLKVWVPDIDAVIERTTIASHEEHLGNMIAEGRLAKEKYWPMLSDFYKARFHRENKAHYALVVEIRATNYAAAWVPRWIAQQEYLSGEAG